MAAGNVERIADDPWAGEDERWEGEDRAREEADRARAEIGEEDILAPARAIILGFVLVLPLWLVIFAVGYAVYRLVR